MKKVVESLKLPFEVINYDFFISSVSKINTILQQVRAF